MAVKFTIPVIALTTLVYNVKQKGSSFFTKGAMGFFGDSIGNYRVSRCLFKVSSYGQYRDPAIEVYKLSRKKPVIHGIQTPTYFDSDFNVVYGIEV